jgi:hypothetical protein
MEAIAKNPLDPGLPTSDWKGRAEHELPNTKVAIAEGRIMIRYQIMADHPVLGLVNVLDFGPQA